jgi:hypothetical protein
MKTKEIIILPYLNKRGHKEYLIKTEKIDNWDQHPDHCSISFEYDDEKDILEFIKENLDPILNLDSKSSHYLNLGICQASKDSKKTYYLYCINISKLDYNYDESKFEFVNGEEILNNIDSQLIVAYSRLEFLRFK